MKENKKSVGRKRIAAAALFLLLPAAVSAETMRSGLDKTLQGAGIDDRGRVMSAVEQQVGSVIDAPLHDVIDFSQFPSARLNVTKVTTPAVLVLSPGLINYVYRGKPDSFQGSFRTYEFFLGKGMQKASHMIYPQVFETIRLASSMNEVKPGELAVVPDFTDFSFRWGGAFIPVMSVDLEAKVAVYADGKKLTENSYAEKNVKEGAGSLFPNEKQEYKAISRALISVLKKSGEDISSSAVIAAFQPAPLKKQQVIGHEKIDMDAVLFLAGSWQQYARNKGRLTELEKQVATRFLRLQDAWEKKDTSKQQEQIDALIAHSKTLEPISRAELLEELKYQKGYTDNQLIEQNEAEDGWYNFAGNYTGTVLDYAGLGIDAAKVTVLAAGCLSSGSTCLALTTTMGQFDLAGTVAEGLGAASEEYFHKSGEIGESLFAGVKSSLIDVGAGEIGGRLAEATVGNLAQYSAKKWTRRATQDVAPDRLIKMQNRIYVDSMELFQRAPEAGASSLLKEGAKRVEAIAEEKLFSEKVGEKSLTNGKTEPESLTAPAFDSLQEL